MLSATKRKPAAQVRAASLCEAAAISSLAIRSKAHWGYSGKFLEARREELSYSSAQIDSADYEFWVCEVGGNIVGFYTLELLGSGEAELEALFVEPEMIGRGFGHMLIEHAKGRAADLGIREIVVQCDPNAESFYKAAGGVRAGDRESASIPGRFLPVFKIEL